MSDPMTIAMIASCVLASLGIIAFAGLRAFSQWISLKQTELSAIGHAEPDFAEAGGLIEMADLKERIRKLEAIASGIDP